MKVRKLKSNLIVDTFISVKIVCENRILFASLCKNPKPVVKFHIFFRFFNNQKSLLKDSGKSLQ